MKLIKLFEYDGHCKFDRLLIPNIITGIRILLSLSMMMIFYLFEEVNISLLVIFSVAACSDKLDGYLAKKYNAVTSLGKLFDPLADKILVFVVLIILLNVKFIPLWAAIVTVLKDLAISSYRYIKLKNGKVMPALKIGRYKTAYNFLVFEMAFLFIAIYGSNLDSKEASFIKYLILTTIL